jgi:hypothetical protein
MKIFRFQTNIKKSSEKKVVEKILKQYKGISKWNIDLKDKDKILHIEGYGITAQAIITAIMETGLLCKECK